ncbi:MAG: peptidase T [Parasporobacterium sp.]|nr:peptidase T [Parasporobacterium sp.]
MKDRLTERFCRYVRVHTSSDENSTTQPSTERQFDLAELLVKEMHEIGISDAAVDEKCNVTGHIPACEGCENAPAIGFIAHLDTVSDFCSRGTVPVLHYDYDGGDITLSESGRVLSPSEFPELYELKGRTVITSDGITVLGADDKAGIAEIITMADEIIKNDIPHGRICIAFTPDEEIGGGAQTLDLEAFGADFAFTADGDTEGTIEYENFNACSASVVFTGVNVHPGSAKDVMVNAACAAAEFNSMLPETETPRNTEGYEGFYHLVSMSGAVESAKLYYIVRDHDELKFAERKKVLNDIASELNGKYGDGTVKIEIKDSYRNMIEKIRPHMHLIEHAKEAIIKTGLVPSVKPVRGGTDGAQLSFRGLPCPNLGTGGHAFHGPYEYISVEGMESAAQILINIASGYAGFSPEEQRK